ncbi:uncharacterized protein [Venturia canescens]|uniref:uncharacterized protein isoform X2 n=1 Tax=Venturia canescens TaxID=32260 RepID=UPI001C9C0FA0|nr:uncharacterized protein LOC122409744 isoform X2 [Venturia canescens]
MIDNRGTTIEVTVKTKGRKSSSGMTSCCLNTPKMMEDKPPTNNIIESHTSNWSRTLREQNRPVLKQGLQQFAGQIQSTKHARHENHERKEFRTITETHQSHKFIRQDSRIFDEIPVKQAAKKSSEQIKTVSHSGVPSTTTIASSLESVEVTDRGVQCGGIFDCSNDRLGIYNPVRVLGILMQEMEGLVRDERSSKILTEMEQALLRIPKDPGKLPPDVLEKIALCTKLEAGMSQLEITSKELEAASAKLRKDKESLQQQVGKQSILLEESQKREKNAEMTIKKLRMDLNESVKVAAENRRVIAALREENKRIEASQKLARDLRRDLNEQIEVAEQRYMEVQYLKLEKDKIKALSSYKDIMLNDLRKKLKELQNHISEQLVTIRETSNQQISLIHGGVACSSPTSTSSKNSFDPHSVAELSEISLPIVDCLFEKSTAPIGDAFNALSDNSEMKRAAEKVQQEFISLPGEETSHTISLTHEQHGQPKLSSSPNNMKNHSENKGEWKLEEFLSAPNLECRNTGESSHNEENEKTSNRSKSKTKKSFSATDNKQHNDENRDLLNEEDDKKAEIERASGDPVRIMKEQFEMIFEDFRRQSKLLVQVQSPPRDYPHAEWSDSSLPTISVMSESNVA